MLNHFFGQRHKELPSMDDKPLTYLLATETDNKGQSVIVNKCVEVANNPACLLSFSDFTLQSMIASGIKPQHLAISADNRIGISDKEISEFASRVESLLSNE